MKSILTILFATIAFFTNGQTRVDLTYFTLGLVDDYLGRSLVKEDKLDLSKIDFFHETETGIMDYLDSLIIAENSFREKNDQIDKRRARRTEKNCTNCHEFFAYYSKKLADQVNSKYNFKFSQSWDHKDRKMYLGRLKQSIWKTDNEKVSFLIGAYLKFGSNDGAIYRYNLANSPSKYKNLIKVLKDLKCEIVDIIVTENSIPASQTVKFKPTSNLKNQFDKLESLKAKVNLKKADFFNAQSEK